MDGGSDVYSAYFVGRLLLGGLDLSSDMVIVRSPQYHVPPPLLLVTIMIIIKTRAAI